MYDALAFETSIPRTGIQLPIPVHGGSNIYQFFYKAHDFRDGA